MLQQFKKHQGNQPVTNPHTIWHQALQTYGDQVYKKVPTDVNQVIQTHEQFSGMRDKTLTFSEIWQGEKLKGRLPHIFTLPIVAAAVIPDTQRNTGYGEVFDRVSIQPEWLTKKMIVVKEEVHVDDLQNVVVFFGKPIDIAEAKNLLIPALINEAKKGSEKALKLLPADISMEQMATYLEKEFEALFCAQNYPLFNVAHGIIGTEEQPVETWEMVRLANSEPSEQLLYDQLRKGISGSVSVKLYLETIKALDTKSASNRI